MESWRLSRPQKSFHCRDCTTCFSLRFSLLSLKVGIIMLIYFVNTNWFMNPVRNEKEVESVAKRATEVLYGSNVENLKVRTLLPYPNEQNREAWDAQVTFLLDGLQYTVDLLINEKDGQITNARLIDTMVPL